MNKLTDDESREKYNREWIEAEYATLGWPKPPLSIGDIEEIDVACGTREYETGKPNPPYFYEEQIIKAVLAKLQPALDQARKEERERIISFLDIHDRDGYVNISNHVSFEEWQALKGGKKC